MHADKWGPMGSILAALCCRARHQTSEPEYLAWVASVLTFGGLWISAAVVAAGLTLLVAVSVWNAIAFHVGLTYIFD
jgi:hypothetical protein